MYTYYIPHTLSIGDITNLSDYDTELIKNLSLYNEGDFINIETPYALYLAQIIELVGKSCKIEIQELITQKKEISKNNSLLNVIQSISAPRKFELVVEKLTEIGVERILPVESEYSKVKLSEFKQYESKWESIAKKAKEQCRRVADLRIDAVTNLKELDLNQEKNFIKVCLATEQVNSIKLGKFLKNIPSRSNILIAIGPESGWSSSDLNIFKKEGFKFVSLNGNILRTETAAIVCSSIIKYHQGKI